MVEQDATVAFGFTEERVPAGGHICFIYADEAERRQVMGPFIRSGLSAGEKVVYLADRPEATAPDAYLETMRISVPTALRPGQFVLAEAETTYCPDGTFRPERMLDTWRSLYRESLDQAFPRVRVTGETTWMQRRRPGLERWFEYEASLNLATARCPFTGIVCQYDATRMDGAAIYNVLNVHPMMIVRRQIVQNPYYEPPETFLARMKARP